MDYRARDIEKKWQKWWDKNQVYKTEENPSKTKYYVLDMFPYPSGAGLHVGHPLGYIASDIISRYKRHCGYQVLHPMGYDAFGLPAEQYAVQTGIHPAQSTNQNIERYRDQLTNLGFDYDWSRELATCEPKYYKWTQWIFLQLFEHYYCSKTNKAKPIKELIINFENKGSDNCTAYTTQKITDFSAAEWKSMTRKEKDGVLMNFRLAYRKMSHVNWCPELGTVLANDEVKDGRSERGGYPVERKPMLQWSLRVTAYANRLLLELSALEWSESLKTVQKNWIGKSVGANIRFPISENEAQIEVFTTRPDTVFGVTFMVLAPEHPLVNEITTPEARSEINTYKERSANLSERDRQSNVDQVTGAFTGAYAIHPFSKEKLPIWISDYVLMEYGTGAIMAVPSDDERDHKFATHFDISIIEVYDKSDGDPENFRAINSDFLNGLKINSAKSKIIEELEKSGLGEKEVRFKLRDAIFSRQRYWGEPIPISYDREGVPTPLPYDQLPLELPDLEDFKPDKGGRSPLAKNEDWVNLPDGHKRETDTMPGFAGSSWYFLRYMDPHNQEEFASKDAINYWRDVDLYIGGTEHAVGHLIYARFWHKFLFDIGRVPTQEPFKKLVNQGMIQGVIESIYLDKRMGERHRFVCASLAEKEGIENFTRILVHADFVEDYGSSTSHLNQRGINQFLNWKPDYQNASFECPGGIYRSGKFEPNPGVDATENHLITHSEVGKMSKSKFNVINPDDVIEEYGADCFRMYEMFLGPIDQSKPWDTLGIDGVSKFLKRFWSLFFTNGKFSLTNDEPPKDALISTHTAIKKVREDIERISFNTCVSHFMVCTNELKKIPIQSRQILEPLIVLIAPFAPHLAEELWHLAGHKESVIHAPYPDFDPKVLKKDQIEYPIAINGKKRGETQFPAETGKEEIEQKIRDHEVVKKWLGDKEIKRIIVVPGKMVNVVIG